jgi:hypothetical protein
MNLKNFYSRIIPARFSNYWSKIKKDKRLDDDIKNITNIFIKSPSYNHVSNFWHILNIKNYKQLLEKGLESYGSTVATNYFTLTDFEEEYVVSLFKNTPPARLILEAIYLKSKIILIINKVLFIIIYVYYFILI